MAFNKDFKKFINLPSNARRVLLKALGYEVKRGYIIHSDTKERIICKYSKKPILFENASIMPGSTIIINSDPLSISQYIGEYLEREEGVKIG